LLKKFLKKSLKKLKNFMQNSDEGNCNGARGQEDDQLLTKTAPFDGLVLILSEAGKPIFYRFLFKKIEWKILINKY